MPKRNFLLRGTLKTAYQIYQSEQEKQKKKIKVFLSRQFCASLKCDCKLSKCPNLSFLYKFGLRRPQYDPDFIKRQTLYIIGKRSSRSTHSSDSLPTILKWSQVQFFSHCGQTQGDLTRSLPFETTWIHHWNHLSYIYTSKL